MKKRFLSVILTLAAVLSMAVMPVTAMAADEEANMYRAYAKIVDEYENKYGEGSCVVEDALSTPYYIYYIMNGTYFVHLLDFNGDGQDELLIGVCENSGTCWVDVWAYENDEAVKVYSPELQADESYYTYGSSRAYYNIVHGSDISLRVLFTRYNGKIYMIQGMIGSNDIYYYYEYTGGSFRLSKIIETCDDYSSFKIDGKAVSQTEWNTQVSLWNDGLVSYLVRGGRATMGDELLSITAETKEKLKSYDGIRVYLNNKEIEFDQEPINQDGNLLVPIRAIAEAMGKTVLRSDEYKAAFIDNTDNALIIPIEDNNQLNAYEQKAIFIADDGGYYSWERKQTNVQPLVLNGRTLVPIRQFAEALGADVEWVQDENAAYITYTETDAGEMDDSLYDSINLNYYIARYSENPFAEYTDIIDSFYDERNKTADAITMGLSSMFDAPSDLWRMSLYGETNASMAIQQVL